MPQSRRPLVRLLALAAALLAAAPAAAETMTITLDYPASALDLAEREGFILASLPGCQLLAEPGAPALPVLSEQVLLPAGTRAVGLRATSLAARRLPCAPPRPAQAPAILGPVGVEREAPALAPPDAAIYGGDRAWPAELALLRGTGRLRGLAVAGCEVRPVQYDPVRGELILHERVRLEITLAADTRAPLAIGREGDMDRLARTLAARRLRGGEALAAPRAAGEAEALDPAAPQYLIITEEAQRAAWEEYAAWKTAKGVPAQVFTTEWIWGAYPAADLAASIRAFIIASVAAHGSSYVLLAGDDHIVPSRIAWAFDCEAGFYDNENEIRADLYFSDLDGTWDADGDGLHGEVTDDVDLYPDVLVGRAPTDDLGDAQAMVGKFLGYERDAAAGHAMDAFFFAEVLWTNPFTDSGIGKDMMAARSFADYEPVDRQYETLGNLSPSSVIDALNAGAHLTNHAGHANYSVMGCGADYLYRSDADALHNAPYFHVLFSIGCWSAAFDENCIAEHFATNGNGGSIAFVGNSRYGWGSPGNPGWGYSETYDSDFYAAILDEGLTQFGAAVVWPKILRVPFSQDGNVYRWHEYQVNLLGDPEMACHTAPITDLVVTAPASVPAGGADFTIEARDAAGPAAGLRACLAGGGVYLAGLTDAAGQLRFTLAAGPSQALTLTVSGPNHPASQQPVMAVGDEPFLALASLTVDDDAAPPSAGNGDGEAGPGEVIELWPVLRNWGALAAPGVTGTLVAAHPDVFVLQGDADLGTVPAGAVAGLDAPLVIQLATGTPVGAPLGLRLDLADTGGGAWSVPLPLRQSWPVARFERYAVSEIAGDGDGVAEPGETVAVTVWVRNEGSGTLRGLTAGLASGDPCLDVLQGAAACAQDLPPGAMAPLAPDFTVMIGAGCPLPGYTELDLSFAWDDGADADAFLLAVGEPGLADDMESGAPGWTHGGVNDRWHLSTERAHSGVTSWYCGDPTGMTYPDNASAWLATPAFVAPEDATVSFWSWFDVTIYGTDGLFVEVEDGGDWRVLDYLGSGGALDSMLFICGWAARVYDLDLDAGQTARVRFRLETDGSGHDEGFYVDDVTVGGGGGPATAAPEIPATLRLSRAWPNPLPGATQWRLTLPAPAAVTARVFDARGRLVSTLAEGLLGGGEHQLRWEGADTAGRPAPAGVYFLRVRAGGETAVRKIVKLGR
ncbi:MAG: T9SS type A sorting domain-containing protein [Candidatus Krumholzibacteriota bacterium]|nr:T9SS type A sorting domain-containing protein [Candidatus Krumholzibacteriota bacterium]